METIFHSLQFTPAFLRTRMVVQEKAIKYVSQISNKCSCLNLRKHQRKQKKNKKKTMADSEI